MNATSAKYTSVKLPVPLILKEAKEINKVIPAATVTINETKLEFPFGMV